MPDHKIEVLDSLRAFAALSVCFFHFVCTTTGYIQHEGLINTFYAGQYGVQLFFVISGFVIPWSMFHGHYQFRHFFRFFLKRLARLEPPYLVSILLVLLALYLREKYMGRSNVHMEVSLKQVMLHLGYLIPFFPDYKWLNQVYWTLAIEFQYYLFIALVYVPLLNLTAVIRYIFFVVVLTGSFFCPPAFLFFWLPVFQLGILLFLYKTRRVGRDEFTIFTMLTVAFCFYRYPVAAVIYAIIPVICVLAWPSVKIYGLHFMGKFSYSIYLVHPVIGASVINVLSHHFTAPLQKFAVIGLGTMVTLLGAYITYLLVERPSKALSASIKYKS